MRVKRKIALITALSLILSLFVLTGCEEDDGKGYIFGYDISANPGSLDPQCADDRQSFLLINVLFEGLLRADSDGNITCAGAKSYDMSEDGLTYTFELNNDRYWVDVNEFEAPCTAEDYVYGFTRLFLPETRAPHASDYFCIKNSEKINSGEITDYSKLGVKADGKYKLIIELEYPNPMFPSLLAAVPAMPCNEEYFLAAQGKYGLSAKTTPSNGAFFLKSWNYDKWSSDNNNLVLRYSEKYSEHDEVYPLGLNFFIDEPENFEADFLDGTSQNIFLSGESAKKMADRGYGYDEYSTAVYGIMMNTKSSVFKDISLRYALLYASDNSNVELPFGYSAASFAVPDAVKAENLSYRGEGESAFIKTDEVKAQSLYQKAALTADKEELHSVTVLAVENRDEDIIAAAQDIFQQWQAKLGFYCTVVYLSESEYNSALKAGEYSLAVVRLTGDSNRPDSYLSAFTDSGYKYSAMSGEYSQLLDSAKNAATVEQSYDYCRQAEKLLLCDGRFIPLAFASEYFFSAKGCSGMLYNPFSGTIDYTKAICIE